MDPQFQLSYSWSSCNKMPLTDFSYFRRSRSFHRDSTRFSQSDANLESSRSLARKSLQPIICMLLVELCERFTFFATVCNMILFCTLKLGYQHHQAAIANLCFVGASMLMPVLVGWAAELINARTKIIYICTLLHFAGRWPWIFLNTVQMTGQFLYALAKWLLEM